MSYTDRTDHTQQVRKLHDMGFQNSLPLQRRRRTDLFLDAIDNSLKAARREDHRHTVIHGQVLREDQLQRMARLGVTVSFFSAHIHFSGRSALRHLSGARSGQSHFTGRIGGTGRCTLYDPQRCIRHANPASASAHCAVNRKTASGRVLGEEERISSPICSTSSND